MKRPLLIMLAGLVLGETWGCLLQGAGVVIPASLFVLFLIGRKMGRKLEPFFFSLFLFSMFLGVLSWNREAEQIGRVEGYFMDLSQEDREDCILQGELIKSRESSSGYTTFTVKNPVFSFASQGEQICLKGKVNLTGKLNPANEEDAIRRRYEKAIYYPGDRVTFHTSVELLQNPRNPGEFNNRNYALSQGILLSGFFESLQLADRPVTSLKRWAYCIKKRMEEGYLQLLTPEDGAILCAMVLGDKSYMTEEERKLYEENGVAHLLAISGLHVSIVGGRIYRSLRRRGFRYGSSCLGGVLFLLFYACMTGFGSSVLRALLMYLAYLLSEFLGLSYDLPSSMSLSGILMLLEHPHRMLEGGFLVSFASVFTIGLVLPLFVKENVLDGDLDGKNPWAEGFSSIKKGIKRAVLCSAIIYGVTGPLILRFYYELTPYCILLNPLVLPFMSPLMVDAILCGLAALLPGGMGRGLPTRLGILPAVFILRAYRLLFHGVRRLPASLFLLGCPPLWALLLIYAMELGIGYLLYKHCLKRALCLLLTGVGIFLGTYHQSFRITMLDVGQGECILMMLPGGKSLLLDGGSTSKKEIFSKVIQPALSYYGISRLDYVFMTHMDEDHVSGIAEMLSGHFPVGTLVTGKGKEPDPEREQMFDLAWENGSRIALMERGQTFHLGKIAFLCLHPEAETVYEDSNDKSLTILVEYGNFRALFTGDLGMGQEEGLGKLPELTLLKVAHHGSKYSTGEALLKDCRPRYAILSAGEGNRYGHPHGELLDRLRNAGTKLYQTLGRGAILMEVKKKGFRIHYYSQ